MKPILLCGPSGCGKSTRIQQLARQAGGPIYGFLTRKETDGHIYIYPAGVSGEPSPLTPAAPCSQNRVGELISAEKRLARPRPEVFDGPGVALLSDIPVGALVIMDELGILESEAHVFRAKVLEVMQGPYRVLAALKDADTPFLNQVRALGEIRPAFGLGNRTP